MKKSILSLLMLVFAGVTATTFAQGVTMGAAIEFEKEVHDYGDVEFGGNGTYAFQFKNTGSEPLMITDAKGSCGCTVPSWPKEPIAPGASSTIEVTYDTKRVGPISKSVTITSNAVNTPVKVIRIAGNVLSAPVVDETVPPTQVMEMPKPQPVVEMVKPEPAVELAPVVPMTEAEIKANAKAEKKRLKAEAKARKKEAKMASKSGDALLGES